jgi:DNA-binding NarL/FixJ family response regulator
MGMLAGMASLLSVKSYYPIRVALMCENPSVYQSLSSRLAANAGFEVIEAVDCQLDNVTELMAKQPHVVILGISRITHFNILVCQAIRQANQQTRIVMLPSYESDPTEAQMAYEAGVAAIMLKSIDTPALVDQICLLMNHSA